MHYVSCFALCVMSLMGFVKSNVIKVLGQVNPIIGTIYPISGTVLELYLCTLLTIPTTLYP